MFVCVMKWNFIEISMMWNACGCCYAPNRCLSSWRKGAAIRWRMIGMTHIIQSFEKITFVVYALIYDFKWNADDFLVVSFSLNEKSFERVFQLWLSKHAVILMDVFFLFKLRKEFYAFAVYLNCYNFYLSWKYILPTENLKDS